MKMEKMEKESLTAQSSPENPAENTPEKPELNERVGIAEAILFVTGNAIEKREMCSAMNLTEQELDETLDELESGYDFDRRGLRLLRFGQHVQVGVSDEEMEFAVNSLIAQEGGIVLVKEGKVIESMPMPIAGLMSDQSGEWVDQKLTDIHEKAYSELGISGEVEPVMTLCFMSLAVIPEVKLTDMGLFDVTTFSFISTEA